MRTQLRSAVALLALACCAVQLAGACATTPYVWTWEGHAGSDTGLNTAPDLVQSVGARLGHAVVSSGAGTLLFGGFMLNTFRSDVWLFDDSAKGWRLLTGAASTLPDLRSVYTGAQQRPGGRRDMAAYGLPDGMVIFGGLGFDGDTSATNSAGSLNDVWRFFVANSSWVFLTGSTTKWASAVYTASTVALTPGSRQFGASWVMASQPSTLYYFGGFLKSGSLTSGIEAFFMSDLWSFSLATNRWTFIGGSKFDRAVCVYDLPGPVWPGGRHAAATWTDDRDLLYLYAGTGVTTSPRDVPGLLNDIWRYSVSAGTWTFVSGSRVANLFNVPGLPDARKQTQLWRENCDSIFIYGGFTTGGGSGTLINDVWRYVPSWNNWTAVHSPSWVVSRNANGYYGTTAGVADPCAFNGARYSGGTWISGGRLWVHAGNAYLSAGAIATASDTWSLSIPALGTATTCFVPPTVTTTTVATSTAVTAAVVLTDPPTTADGGRVNVAAIVVPILLALVLAALLIIFLVWRRRRNPGMQNVYYSESTRDVDFHQSPLFVDNPWQSTVDMAEVFNTTPAASVTVGAPAPIMEDEFGDNGATDFL